MTIPLRILGKNGHEVSAIGMVPLSPQLLIATHANYITTGQGTMGLSIAHGPAPAGGDRFCVLSRAVELGSASTHPDSADT